MKRTHKFKAMGDVTAIVSAATSMTDAAKKLGVDRSTLHRWVKAGKVPEPQTTARPRRASIGAALPQDALAPDDAPKDAAGNSPASVDDPGAWAAAARTGRVLTPTKSRLVDLAAAALTLAGEGNHPAIRLSAMGRFQGLVKQLDLDADVEDDAKPTDAKPTRRPATVIDHRRILSAVK